MSFFTRPNFEDRQQVQYNGSSITLSGFTNINNTGYLKVKSQTLDFTGTTTASTLYNIAGVNGYINNGELSSLIVEPPVTIFSGSTGSTTVDVTGYVLTSLDSEGRVVWQTPTGSNSGNCISDFYVSNIHGCSPITVWDQLQHIGSSATTQLSTSFGYNNRSYGQYSSSHGYNNRSGGKGFIVKDYTITDGLLVLDPSYGNVTSELSTYYSLVLVNNGGPYALEPISGFSYDNILSATTIQLTNTTITTNDCYDVININNIDNTSGDILFGDYSNSEGYYNNAVGNGSHAEGGLFDWGSNMAIGSGSHAEGVGNISLGIGSHVEGYDSKSIGGFSHAEGRLTKSNGGYSHSEGYDTKTYASYSHTEGHLSTTGLVYLNAEYDYDSGSGYIYVSPSHGDVTKFFEAGDVLFISDVDYNKYFLVSNDEYSVIDVSFDGDYTILEISPVVNLNNYDIILGNITNPLPLNTITLSNIYGVSHAEGYNTLSFGAYSHSEGKNTISYGNNSHSQGESTKSIGINSFSSGLDSYADGDQTFIHSTNSHIKNSVNSSILGGEENIIESNLSNNSIIGGNLNTIDYGVENSSILGGNNNIITASTNTTIIGGNNNRILNTITSNSIIGGGNNNINGEILNSSIIGGNDNTIDDTSDNCIITNNISSTISNSDNSSIIGGGNNNILDSPANQIFGGGSNTIRIASTYNTIINGSDNTIRDNSNYNTIVGGDSNYIDNNINNVTILGVNSLTPTISDTVFVPNLVVSQPYIPSSSGDTGGDVGNISWDETHLYIKTNTGWGRISLDYAW